MLIWLFTLACASGTLDVTPTSLEFGEVDFMEDVPSAGLNPIDLLLENAGEGELTNVTLSGVDAERFEVTGIVDSTLDEGQALQLTVGVAGYDIEGGELTTEVTGNFFVNADELSESVAIPWSYTPVRNIEDDTAVR